MKNYRADETRYLEGLTYHKNQKVEADARHIIENTRKKTPSFVSSLLHTFPLSTQQGKALMYLSEALLRIPDNETANLFLKDTFQATDWEDLKHKLPDLKRKTSLFAVKTFSQVLQRSPLSLTDTALQKIVKIGTKFVARNFILGETIDKAIQRSSRWKNTSYDMLGEAALTEGEAEAYFQRYKQAIFALEKTQSSLNLQERPGISVKLSALHPRYTYLHRDRVVQELTPRLDELVSLCHQKGLSLTVDAEEADTLDLSLEIIEKVARNPAFKGWDGLGLAVQAYQKRAQGLIDWAHNMALVTHQRLQIRLVKGAYWDTEIKRAQELGLDGYPVFTRKMHTDMNYLACAEKLLGLRTTLYPMFATHNAHSIAAIVHMADDLKDLEFQRLHGMGELLYEVVKEKYPTLSCRVYAPVGPHKELLPYLVRRILENGANSSFMNKIVDDNTPVEDLIKDPQSRARKLNYRPHPKIPLPKDLYGSGRKNAYGLDLSDDSQRLRLEKALKNFHPVEAFPIVQGKRLSDGEKITIRSPFQPMSRVGTCFWAQKEHIHAAFESATSAQTAWAKDPMHVRAACLQKAADDIEEKYDEWVALCMKEAGKTMGDAIAEIREAIDFCRYYAHEALSKFSDPRRLPGPAGEDNIYTLHGRGVFVCISPWNFPMAIFMGQVVAALVAGNAVLAKPAGPTPLIAYRVVETLHQAGVPQDVLHFIPCQPQDIGPLLFHHPSLGGVAFTGSTSTAKEVTRQLAEREGAIVPLIAETGGQNAMVLDTSAHIELAVKDVLASAFQSAGQRCSALRLVCVPDSLYEVFTERLRGAMDQLQVGDPCQISTDVGPVIHAAAKAGLSAYVEKMKNKGLAVYTLPAPSEEGTFVPPTLIEIDHMNQLEGEMFGPILHVLRYSNYQDVLDQINGLGFGLTFGLQSRIQKRMNSLSNDIHVGNIYVNRNIVGAVVGVQPFGGQGLSGTGPKAGGPYYLTRFMTERVTSINILAQGGDVALLSINDEDRD